MIDREKRNAPLLYVKEWFRRRVWEDVINGRTYHNDPNNDVREYCGWSMEALAVGVWKIVPSSKWRMIPDWPCSEMDRIVAWLNSWGTDE